MEPIISGLWAGYALAIPVGALAVLLVSLSARTSLRVGASAAMGAATADGLYAVAAMLGGAALASIVEPVTSPLRWLAAAILAFMALRIAATAIRRRDERETGREGLGTPLRAFLGFLGLTLLNPWTIIYFAALVLSRETGGDSVAAAVAYVGAVFAASMSWQLFLAGSGAALGRLLTSPRGRTVTAVVSSVVIGALAIKLAVSG